MNWLRIALLQERRTAALLTCVFMLCASAQRSWAWGREGHRLTALVAEQYLTEDTKAQIALLLHRETLADIAPWADSYRDEHPETSKWHFVDIPKSADKFDRLRDCPASATDPKSPWRDCVTDRILFFEGRLGDASLKPEERAMALKFLVHFIGDIHQPFHALGDDRGGNGIIVEMMGAGNCGSRNCNLHGVWDDSIIEAQGLNEKKYTEKLLAEIKENQWERLAGGEPTTWANISHRYAVQMAMPNGAMLTKAYVQDASKIVDSQLALAGLRLARVLNRTLGNPDSAAAPALQAVPTGGGAVTTPK